MATRAERKAKRRAIYAAMDLQREQQRQRELAQIEARRQYERAHPILSGAIQIVDYKPPR